MFCSNCGKEIPDNAVICVHCGCGTNNFRQNSGNDKSMIVAVVLLLFLGGLGIHRFYLGHTGSGITMLLCALFCWLIIPAIILGIWWIVDLILLICGGLQPADGGKLI